MTPLLCSTVFEKTLRPKRETEEPVDLSINETLSRTLLTSATTLFVVTMLLLFGGEIIHDFAFAPFVGILVGTYSSMY